MDGSAVKNLPAKQETQEMQVQSLFEEYSLEEEMAIHNSIPVWKIPWTENPGWLQFIGSQRVGHNSMHADADLLLLSLLSLKICKV